MRDEFALDRECDMEQFKYTQIQKLLLWLSDNVKAEGGDGDAIWISRWHTLEEVRQVAIDTFKGSYWEVTEIEQTKIGRYFNIGVDQEWITIADSIGWPVPSWSQCTLVW